MMKISDNTVKAVQAYFEFQLHPTCDEREVELFFEEVFYHLKSWSRLELRMNKNERLSESELVRIIHIVKELKTGRPLQYVLGYAHFMGLELKVTKSTLIPRPETEELVSWVIERGENYQSIVDIGTGSGCIAMALKNELPKAKIIGMDVSEEALEVAQFNSDKYHLEVKWEKGDILSQFEDLPRVDCIVSNPPYIPELDKSSMEAIVLDYEPHLALFTPGNDDLVFYNYLARYAQDRKSDLFVEIHFERGDAVKQLFHTLGGRDIVVKKDLSGKDRMVYTTWQE